MQFRFRTPCGFNKLHKDEAIDVTGQLSAFANASASVRRSKLTDPVRRSQLKARIASSSDAIEWLEPTSPPIPSATTEKQDYDDDDNQ